MHCDMSYDYYDERMHIARTVNAILHRYNINSSMRIAHSFGVSLPIGSDRIGLARFDSIRFVSKLGVHTF